MTAFDHGQDAARKGLTAFECPYESAYMRSCWFAGWRAAKHEL